MEYKKGHEMIWISNRGNLEGPNPEQENHPLSVDIAIRSGFDVKIDLWQNGYGDLFLGNSKPTFRIEKDWFLERGDRLWVQCSSREVLESSLDMGMNSFMTKYKEDVFTGTGYRWVLPGNPPVSSNSIQVLPETIVGATEFDNALFAGVCTNIPSILKESVKNEAI